MSSDFYITKNLYQ